MDYISSESGQREIRTSRTPTRTPRVTPSRSRSITPTPIKRLTPTPQKRMGPTPTKYLTNPPAPTPTPGVCCVYYAETESSPLKVACDTKYADQTSCKNAPVAGKGYPHNHPVKLRIWKVGDCSKCNMPTPEPSKSADPPRIVCESIRFFGADRNSTVRQCRVTGHYAPKVPGQQESIYKQVEIIIISQILGTTVRVYDIVSRKNIIPQSNTRYILNDNDLKNLTGTDIAISYTGAKGTICDIKICYTYK